MVCKYFLPFCSLPVSFAVLCLLLLNIVPLVYFCFCCWCFWHHIQKSFSKIDIPQDFLLSFLQEFTVSRFLLKSLIHCELMFVHGVGKGPISFFCMWLSIFPTPCTEETLLSHCVFVEMFQFFIEYDILALIFWLFLFLVC